MDPVAFLNQLVSTPSVSHEEDAAIELVLSTARKQGLMYEQMGRNAVITLGQGGGKRLLLNSHVDTVPPSDRWEHEPFALTSVEDRLVGLGANDAGGCVASMFSAVAALHSSGWSDGEVVLALTVEEETGGEGLEILIDDLGDFDGVVIGEPTGLDLCVAQKGLLVLEVFTTGQARHAAHAHRIPGTNAVVELAKAITRLKEIPPFDEHPFLGPLTCQVTKVWGGDRHNVIPDEAGMVLDIRTVPTVRTEDIVGWVETTTGAEVNVRSDRLKAFETREDEAIVSAAVRAHPEGAIFGSATLSDACWTRHLPTIKVGPGDSDRSHQPDEYVTLSELENGVDFYRRLIQEFCK
jgi:acetylornithine deacetylase